MLKISDAGCPVHL